MLLNSLRISNWNVVVLVVNPIKKNVIKDVERVVFVKNEL
jgi:hypothetical protein